jgi:SAM-dependent methyltransferase
MCALLSPSVARNRLPILGVLRAQIDALALRPISAAEPAPESAPVTPVTPGVVRVLEVAAGTGEHAAFFCSQLPHLVYQPTEPDHSKAESIRSWAADLLDASTTSRVLPPLLLGADELADLSLLPACLLAPESGAPAVDVVLCVNMIHISPFRSTHDLFRAAQAVLRPGGIAILYGPFREGQSMVESNEAFDASLRHRDETWGIRELEEVREVAAAAGLVLTNRIEMPANNLCVVFEKSDSLKDC